MSWTKRQFALQAFEELGLAAYVYDLTDDAANHLESAVNRLDAMMASWNAKGIRLGYPLPGSPEDSDIESETNVPDAANEAVYLNLAIRLAPAYGKTVSPDTKTIAQEAYEILMARAAIPRPMQMPGGFPLGAGNRRDTLESPFTETPDDPLLAGQDGPLDFS